MDYALQRLFSLSKCQRPKTGRKPPLNRYFPAGGGPTEKKSFSRKLRKTILDSVATFFFHLGPRAPGNCVFARVRDFSKCQRPKMGQKTTESLFPAGGGPGRENVVPEQVAVNHHGYRCDFCFHFGTASTGKLCFRVSRPGPGFVSVPKAQNGPKDH